MTHLISGDFIYPKYITLTQRNNTNISLEATCLLANGQDLSGLSSKKRQQGGFDHLRAFLRGDNTPKAKYINNLDVSHDLNFQN